MENQENEEIKNEVTLIQNTADSLIISNNEDLNKATEFIKEIKARYKSIESFYEPMITSAKTTYDTVKAERDKYLKPLKQAENDIKGIMNDYNNKILALQRAEEERVKQEEAERQKKLVVAQKELMNGNPDAREQIQEALETTIESRQINIKPAIAGMSVRNVVKITVKDIEKVPAKLNGVPLLELSKLGTDYIIKEYKISKALKQPFEIPGIEIKEEVTTVIR